MCGVVGIYGHPEASNLAYLGLYALQHRGQESAGIVATDGEHLRRVREMGHVNDIFTADRLAHLPGFAAIGHVRYSTAGDSSEKNAQPIAVEFAGGSVAVGHNGNLVNAREMRERLEADGAIFSTTADTEVIVHLIARSKEHALPDRIADALSQVRGAYSLVFLSEGLLMAVRDPMGFRPLVLGQIRKPTGTTWVISSETCAFELIGAEFVRDVEPGEMIVIDKDGLRSVRPLGLQPPRRCVFEWVYFARPDSTIDGRSVYRARERMGRRLAVEHPVPADVVIPVPDSGVAAAIGYARQSGIPYDQGLMRSHYMGRTFIEPSQQIRHFGVKLKLSPVREVLNGKRVVVVDDSIVRGTTSRKIVGMIRAAGATEVHMRISSPPTVGPCHYGIDTPTREELIASHNSVTQIRDFVAADSVGYLSLPGLYESVDGKNGAVGALDAAATPGAKGFCDACFSGNYPIDPEPPGRPRQLRLINA
ncbi:MAG TPA: amidophosphoribosyltransferase [Polyangia bacterium]|nr:amidophosphoribosyltransferase [Polyangia bacterium]